MPWRENIPYRKQEISFSPLQKPQKPYSFTLTKINAEIQTKLKNNSSTRYSILKIKRTFAPEAAEMSAAGKVRILRYL